MPRRSTPGSSEEELKVRVLRYIQGMYRVLSEAKFTEVPVTISPSEVKMLIDWVKSYVEDSRAFLDRGDVASSLVAVCYAEGIMEALRLLKLAEFEW
ncbi:MAG: DUF357 domain-containing protein [Nitrososphaerota archaeon]|nr:DUF357 domain-containing protein [Candidatus Bathyarchaeota archaeon]MCX8161967.1 DUF357 domain-containing protein [Candidatus Bathyarchaeota archaeon]MDW8062342.1 DUF357 domain-containing protein [Nitrososphaerota archaeon]